MKLNNFMPSFGFFILLISILLTYNFFNWVQNATYNLSKLENQANILYSNKKYQESYEAFIKIAKLSTTNIDKSRRYRCAANAAHALNKIDIVLRMLKEAFNANPENKNAKALLNAMLNAKQITQQDIKDIGVDYK